MKFFLGRQTLLIPKFSPGLRNTLLFFNLGLKRVSPNTKHHHKHLPLTLTLSSDEKPCLETKKIVKKSVKMRKKIPKNPAEIISRTGPDARSGWTVR